MNGPTYPCLALRALARYPERVAFQSAGRRITYAMAAAAIGRMQAVLSARGVARHSVVALLSANRWDSWCAGVAAQALGAGMTPLHPMGGLETQLFQLADSGATLLLVDGVAFGERGAELAARCPGLEILTLGQSAFGTDLLALMENAGTASPQDCSHPADLGTLDYSGGTTGRPKGVVRTNFATAQMAVAVLAEFELPATPHFLAVAPISHVTGTNILPTLLRGGTVHLLERFDPEQVLSTIARERVNVTLMVPTMIYAMLDHPSLEKYDLQSLELLMYGASPILPARLGEALERIGPVFSQLYGQSECYPIAVLLKADHDPARPHLLSACGFPAAASAVVLLDDQGNPVAPGEPGEICVRAAHAMSAYWRQPELTSATIVDGWVHTGDVAKADGEGRLYIVDRKKDMIISGGFNVYPKEVEDVLCQHPAVASVAVVGVPDAKWGEAVKAVVVLRAGMQASAKELIALVKERRGPVYAPKSVEFQQTLPLTPLGKVDKKALRS